MSKTVAAIALTLAVGIGTPAKTHHHHQEAMPEKTSNVSDTDAWRHFRLHVAANLPPMTLPSKRGQRFPRDIQHCLEVARGVREGHR